MFSKQIYKPDQIKKWYLQNLKLPVINSDKIYHSRPVGNAQQRQGKFLTQLYIFSVNGEQVLSKIHFPNPHGANENFFPGHIFTSFGQF